MEGEQGKVWRSVPVVPKPDPQAKPHLFVDMFSRKEYCRMLYLALHPEVKRLREADIGDIRMSRMVIERPYNDLVFTVKNRMLVLVEAQGRWSGNIALELLLHLADAMAEAIQAHDDWDIHETRRLPLPVPEFCVIYTGNSQSVPERLSLRRDFWGDVSPLELEARVFSAEDAGNIIGQYIIYARTLERQVKQYGCTRRAAEETVRICRERGALQAYMARREEEVIEGMMALFDQEEAVKRYGRRMLARGETNGKSQGMAQGLAEGMLQGMAEGTKQTNEQTARRIVQCGGRVALIMRLTDLTEPEARKIYKEEREHPAYDE